MVFHLPKGQPETCGNAVLSLRSRRSIKPGASDSDRHARAKPITRSHRTRAVPLFMALYVRKLINNSTSYNKGNHNRVGGLKIWGGGGGCGGPTPVTLRPLTVWLPNLHRMIYS